MKHIFATSLLALALPGSARIDRKMRPQDAGESGLTRSAPSRIRIRLPELLEVRHTIALEYNG